ncbi:C40 family peptidase [Citricoccus nitrophenolicus]|uniref:C40 family peptidase n=1 Tax=Citricoccus nitrophenolicus TaxID=863575 RepID=UPI0039B54048
MQWATAKAADPGVGYVWGGNGPTGYDCSGFTQNAFAQAGIELPRNSKAQYAAASQYVSLDNLQVGDLVFWSNNGSASGIYHVAMYIGDGKIAHARNPQMGVAVTDVDYSPWNMMGTAARY